MIKVDQVASNWPLSNLKNWPIGLTIDQSHTGIQIEFSISNPHEMPVFPSFAGHTGLEGRRPGQHQSQARGEHRAKVGCFGSVRNLGFVVGLIMFWLWFDSG